MTIMTGTFKFTESCKVFRFDNGNSVSFNGSKRLWEVWRKGGSLKCSSLFLEIALRDALN